MYMCAVMTVFGYLLDIVQEVIESPVSERDYHAVVSCLRAYTAIGMHDAANEQFELQRRGWSLSYHPCKHMENIRFAMTFDEGDNARLHGLMAV
jgi:hypothetical protein